MLGSESVLRIFAADWPNRMSGPSFCHSAVSLQVVGELDGTSVGGAVGEELGLPLGDADGFELGKADGEELG